jgi:hypothetical protein
VAPPTTTTDPDVEARPVALPDLIDEGGWLGPPLSGGRAAGRSDGLLDRLSDDEAETARQQQSTRRFAESDLRAASARRNGLVVLLIAVAVLGVAAGSALVLSAGSPREPAVQPTGTSTVSAGTIGAPFDVKVTRDGVGKVIWADPTARTVSSSSSATDQPASGYRAATSGRAPPR